MDSRNRLIVNVEALQHNLRVIDGWMTDFGARWTLATKVLCGHHETLSALHHLGISSMADSRLANLTAVRRACPEGEAWYLRPPRLSKVEQVVATCDVSLNSELAIIEALDQEAGRQGKVHRVIIMIELGDLREGILPSSLIEYYGRILSMQHVEVLGIGANLGCLAGAIPNVEQFTQLALYRELLELKFGLEIPLISAGSSAVIPLLLEGLLPKAINHFRIGEAAFLGTDLVNGGRLPELRDDVVRLDVEVAEVKEKSLVALGETGDVAPFHFGEEDEEELAPGQRGYRALLSIGQLDTDVAGLTPLKPDVHLAGASSDITVVNLGEDPGRVTVGGTMSFRPSYSSLARLMAGPYVAKTLDRSLSEFETSLKREDRIELDAVVSEDDGPELPVARPA